MGSLSIPVHLPLAELSAIALTQAAANLSTASDRQAFLAALEGNHHLWRVLVGVAHQQSWKTPDSRQAEFVMSISRKCGLGVCDDHVEALIGINSRVASQLIGGGDLHRATTRATLAWTESGLGESVHFHHWLLEEILRKTRHHDMARNSAVTPQLDQTLSS
jgi:hypothetical protein